jgi:hypothetical protein
MYPGYDGIRRKSKDTATVDGESDGAQKNGAGNILCLSRVCVRRSVGEWNLGMEELN